jgi:hypothetical protein
VDGLSFQRRNAYLQGCKQICAQSLIENVWDLLFLLMKHGNNTLHDPFILFFSGDGKHPKKGGRRGDA